MSEDQFCRQRANYCEDDDDCDDNDDDDDNDNDDDDRRAKQTGHFHLLKTLSNLETTSKASKLSHSVL